MTKKVKCPSCREETTWEDNKFSPFCSERCKLLDLGKWLDEEYGIECEPDGFELDGEIIKH